MISQYLQNDIVNALPSYFDPLLHIEFVPLVLYASLFIAIFTPLIFIFLWLARLKMSLTKSRTFLEVKPTYKTLQSPLSTKKLFTVIHYTLMLYYLLGGVISFFTQESSEYLIIK